MSVFEQDYIMRLIHEMIRAILKLLFHIKEEEVNEEAVIEEKDSLEKFEELITMVEQGKINEAENQLYDYLDVEDIQKLRVALLFYENLNNLDADYLKECNFSREEIKDGLTNVLKMYGYEGLTEAFFI